MKTVPGLNVQFPISRLILSGEKTIETRTYPIPDSYLGTDVAIIETPGTTGKFKARIIGIVRFSESFQYKDKRAFYRDTDKHCVTPDSPWAWKDTKKWGWRVQVVSILAKPIPAPKKRGIRFSKAIRVPQ